MEPRIRFDYGKSVTQRIMTAKPQLSEDDDMKSPYNKWTLLAAIFMKYGIAPLVCLLFAYWLQEKDKQLLDQYNKQLVLTEKTTAVIDSNTRALDNLTRELRETHR